MTSEVLIAVLSLLGTAFGSVTGIMAANRNTFFSLSHVPLYNVPGSVGPKEMYNEASYI